MPNLSPFQAVRYAAGAGDPQTLLAPPYDVIDRELAADLRARSAYNAVHLVLPEGPAPGRYQTAGRRFTEWLRSGVLVEKPRPAIFLYRQSFPVPGDPSRPALHVERRSVFAALRLVPLGQGGVLPHERTHRGPLEDRLALTLACRAQLSSVFLLAADPQGALLTALSEAEQQGEPLFEARTDDGVAHELRRLEEGRLASDLCRRAGAAPLLIADGHHRYETALAAARALGGSEPARSVLACITSEADPGLLVFPTHRSLRIRPPGGSWNGALSDCFELHPDSWRTDGTAGRDAATEAARARGLLAVVRPDAPALRLTPRAEALRRAAIGEPERRVASVLFDRLILNGILHTSADRAAREGFLSYHRDPERAIRSAGPDGAVFLLPPLPVADVRAVAAAGGRLPPKTTYFAPKIPSGLLFRRLCDADPSQQPSPGEGGRRR
ncbi:MAG: DUF1015 family protein [Gemmatimonadota bacterium]